MLVSFLNKMKSDTDFRITLFLSLSLFFNFVYALFLFVVSQLYRSKWFFIMSIYYGLLATARIFIFLQTLTPKRLRQKILLMRNCGYFLFLLNTAVSVMMFVLIYTAPNVQHHEITVIALAAYTFSTLSIAIVSSIKYMKNNHYVYSCVKLMSLVCASVSMVTLTNTMLTTFGEGNILLRSVILPLLSGCVSILIILSALFMIKKSNLHLRKLNNEEE